MKSTKCRVTCQGTRHQEVALFLLSSVWLQKSRTLWSLITTSKRSIFMNSPAQLRGTLTHETLRKATNMLTSPLTSHIWVAKWIALRCLPKDSFQPETIPHWTHSTSLSNQTSPSHNFKHICPVPQSLLSHISVQGRDHLLRAPLPPSTFCDQEGCGLLLIEYTYGAFCVKWDQQPVSGQCI